MDVITLTVTNLQHVMHNSFVVNAGHGILQCSASKMLCPAKDKDYADKILSSNKKNWTQE